MKFSLRLAGLASAALLSASSALAAQATSIPSCSQDIFSCGSHEVSTQQDPVLQYVSLDTYNHYRQFYPHNWDQLSYNQQHNPVFTVGDGAPDFLRNGTFWFAPLTGFEFMRVAHAGPRYGDPQVFGSTAAQWLGNVEGLSVVDGIAYVQESANALYALDAKTGNPIWCRCEDELPSGRRLPPVGPPLVNAAMGHTIVETINGRTIVFVSTGDVAFTLQNAVAYANGQTVVRGANFTSVYALDGLTGDEIWRFDTKGEAMPTPVYKNGTLFINTGDGHLYSLDARSGTLLSTFANPGLGFSSMSSPNWFTTKSGRLLMIYGTQHPANMVAVDVTNPAAAKLAWSYLLPNAISTGLGDVPPVVDPEYGFVITDALVANGTNADGTAILDINVFALDAATGKLKWSRLACQDYYGTSSACTISPNSFRGSIPMVNAGNLYVGVLLDETYRSYKVKDGSLRWVTSISNGIELQQPRGGGVYYNGRVVQANGRHIHTFDPNTGVILNDFTSPGYFAVWGITTPVIVGNQMYLGSISGWAFAAPASFLMTSPGYGDAPTVPPSDIPMLPKPPAYYNASALPTSTQASAFPSAWYAYAGGQEHNAYFATGPSGVQWQTPLNASLALNAPPRDEAIFGSEVATHMTTLAFGVGTGVAPVNGIVYTGSDRYTVNALNAYTGELIWRFSTINANFGQPLVTPEAVVVASAGDPWMNFSQVVRYMNGSAFNVGASFQDLHGLDPKTGVEKWNFYTAGTNAMTPLYYNGNLYWLNGQGYLWAINASTGEPVAPYLDSDGNPALPRLLGDNVIDSANIYIDSNGSALMLVGTFKDSVFYGIDIATGKVRWTQTLASYNPYLTGFAPASPAVDQAQGLLVSTVLVNADTTNNTASLLAFALNVKTGAVVWTKNVGSGPIPYGYTAATPMLNQGSVYLLNSIAQQEVSLTTATGAIRWTQPVTISNGKLSWGPGVVTGTRLIQAVGPDLYTFDTRNGRIVNVYNVGGSFTYNNPAVIGSTLYIGNSWGWVLAYPLTTVTTKSGGV